MIFMTFDYEDHLEHAWTKHKYLRIENGRYIYPKDLITQRRNTNRANNKTKISLYKDRIKLFSKAQAAVEKDRKRDLKPLNKQTRATKHERNRIQLAQKMVNKLGYSEANKNSDKLKDKILNKAAEKLKERERQNQRDFVNNSMERYKINSHYDTINKKYQDHIDKYKSELVKSIDEEKMYKKQDLKHFFSRNADVYISDL